MIATPIDKEICFAGLYIRNPKAATFCLILNLNKVNMTAQITNTNAFNALTWRPPHPPLSPAGRGEGEGAIQ